MTNMTIAEILRDPKKSQDEKNEAIAQLAEAYESAGESPSFEERKHWSIGAYAETANDAEGALDEAFKTVKDKYAKPQYEEAKKTLLKDIQKAGEGPFSLSITGVEPAKDDTGNPWSFSISKQVSNA